MKIGARNSLGGAIVAIVPGTLNVEGDLEPAGGERSVPTLSGDPARQLGLRKGRRAHALIEASSVMLATD